MKRKIIAAMRWLCRRYPLENFLRALLRLVYKLNSCLDTSDVPDYGVRFSYLRDDHLPGLLDELPTETSRAERRFLHFFFSRLWSGRDHVLEVGPFLGGSTRAIALGMLENKHLSADSRLATYDRFRDYYSRLALTELLRPLIHRGLLAASDLTAIGESASFLDVFERLHSKHEYFKLIEPVCESLPGTAREAEQPGRWMVLPPGKIYSAVFVDGCKSWYGTKYFMRQVASATREDCVFLFQDYEHFTCFWIPSLVHLFADYFEPVAHIDTTYVFSLKRQLTPAVVDGRFPDDPAQLGGERFRKIFEELTSEAARRQDQCCQVAHALHLAGALAYLGDLGSARRIIDEAAQAVGATNFRRQIRKARRSPTYLPNGEQIRL